MTDKINILIAKESADDCDHLLQEITKAGLIPEHQRIDTENKLLEALKLKEWDIVLSDFSTPEFNSLRALALLRSAKHDIPFVIISGASGIEMAVEAMRAGANDYILKNKLSRLPDIINREVKSHKERQKRREIENFQKETQQQQVQIHKLESLSLLANRASHDLSSLLFVMQLYFKKIESLNNPQVNAYLEKIKPAYDRSKVLTKKLQSLSHLKPNQISAINLNQVLNDKDSEIRALVGDKIEVEIVSNYEQKQIYGDITLVEQILFQLVTNARDAMPDGGKLRLTLESHTPSKPVTANQSFKTPYILLGVSDTGFGVPKEILNKIFEPFFTTKHKSEHIGLGLSIVSGIVHQMNGLIKVHSDKDSGTQFQIYFPVIDQKSRLSHKEPHSLLRSKNETVLIVEDESDLLSIFSEMLQAQGYTVLQASDGMRALELLRTNVNIDLVVTDLIIPKLLGLDLYAEAQSICPYTRFVFMTGYSPDLVDPLAENNIEVLQKPFSESTLLQKIRSILDDKNKTV